jgi:hypothetical protein
MNANLHVGPALQTAKEAYRAAKALYLADPDDEIAAANTPVPIHLEDTAMRAKRTDLEKLVADVVIKANIDLTPGLRDSIRAALDKGATPAQIRRKWGARSPYYRQHPTTALSVEFIVDEWERERGRVKADESIDRVEDYR